MHSDRQSHTKNTTASNIGTQERANGQYDIVSTSLHPPVSVLCTHEKEVGMQMYPESMVAQYEEVDLHSLHPFQETTVNNVHYAHHINIYTSEFSLNNYT